MAVSAVVEEAGPAALILTAHDRARSRRARKTEVVRSDHWKMYEEVVEDTARKTKLTVQTPKTRLSTQPCLPGHPTRLPFAG